MIASINPVDNTLITSFEPATPTAIEAALVRAAAAFARHRETPLAERAAKLARAAEILETESDRYGRLLTLEMGKPIAAARAEVAKCALACRYYAEHGAALLADEIIPTSARRSLVRYQPLGVVLAVMPWNFPFWQVFRFAAPSLMAGNTGILKHASNVPQSALAIEEILRRAGFDGDEFQTLLITSSQVESLLVDDRIAAATLTGSEGAGRSVGSIAGREIKKVVLELGGSDPFVIMPSADIDTAAQVAAKARCVNNGQSCIAAKRFIVHRDVAGEFTTKFVAAMRALRVGDPMDESTDVGPLATPQILEEVAAFVDDATALGAKALCGGRRVDGPGNYYPPTVLVDIPSAAKIVTEEVFGPVAALFVAKNKEDAVRIANATPFGLGAAAWTRDEEEQRFFADRIEAGQVFINAMVASDPRVPFGGIRRSGFGRELGPHGIREFVNAKTIWVA
ncbi:MAG: NAD-dependent succinate-semialdehyde dehydrogenase [Thermoanaerobaculia bacterium]|nr:NAD-dependent succinate-semialdehyde dehydrogenase [Thermoanaerobaculia bacterium]